MSSKVSLTIPSAVSAILKDGVSKELKLQVARAQAGLSACDLGVALIMLSQDRDPEVKAAAIVGLRGLPEKDSLEIASSTGTHPRILDILARLHYNKQGVVRVLLAHPNLPVETANFLKEKLQPVTAPAVPPVVPLAAPTGPPCQPSAPPPPEETVAIEEDEECDEVETESPAEEESEAFQSKYQLYQSMGVADKIKMALTGDKEWRSMLIKDSNKLVSGAVVKNPRITEGEVLAICKSVVQNDEIIRVICMNKEWIKNYQVRKALALNAKTPLPTALRYVATLTEKDLASMAKSKNISTAIASQARRVLTAKSKH